MSHIVEIDHSKARRSQRHIEGDPGGRIASESAARPPDHYKDLGRELAGVVDGEVRFDSGSRALYATDASNYRQVPIGVVIPRSVAAVARTLEICRKFDAMDDVHAPANYRQHLATVMSRRALEQALARLTPGAKTTAH